MTFYNRIDGVMLERILDNGESEAGIYASAYRLLDASNMIAFLFAGLLLPIFSRMIKYNESINDLAIKSFSIIFILSINVSVLCFFFRKELMGLMYHDHVVESARVFGILMFCFIPISVSYIFGTLLTANGNLKQLNIIAASGMLFNILVNFIIIPKYYAVGSAYVSLITQTLTTIAQTIYAVYKFKIVFGVKFWRKLILYVVCLFLFGFINISIIDVNWLIKVAFIFIFSIIMVLGLKIIKISAIREILIK